MELLSVNVGRGRPLLLGGTHVLSGIAKRAAAGPVEVGPMGLAGDEQADLSVHGGLSKAVYAYASDHYPFWVTVRAQARVGAWEDTLPWGFLGENLTLAGLDETRLWVGDRLCIGHCVLAVSEPRLPCAKFAAVMGFAQAPKLMAQSGFCGSYLTVVESAPLEAGQPVQLEPGPREVNLRDLFWARMGQK